MHYANYTIQLSAMVLQGGITHSISKKTIEDAIKSEDPWS